MSSESKHDAGYNDNRERKGKGQRKGQRKGEGEGKGEEGRGKGRGKGGPGVSYWSTSKAIHVIAPFRCGRCG